MTASEVHRRGRLIIDDLQSGFFHHERRERREDQAVLLEAVLGCPAMKPSAKQELDAALPFGTFGVSTSGNPPGASSLRTSCRNAMETREVLDDLDLPVTTSNVPPISRERFVQVDGQARHVGQQIAVALPFHLVGFVNPILQAREERAGPGREIQHSRGRGSTREHTASAEAAWTPGAQRTGDPR